MRFSEIKYLVCAVILLLVLVVPFLMKLSDERLEVYPSIIMPSGASLVHRNNNTVNNRTSYEIYGYKQGVLSRVNLNTFFAPIPLHYVTHIAKSNFGLEQFSDTFAMGHFLPFKMSNYNRFCSTNLVLTRRFYRKKLTNMGFDDSLLIYRTNKIHNDSSQNKTLLKEKTYILK